MVTIQQNINFKELLENSQSANIRQLKKAVHSELLHHKPVFPESHLWGRACRPDPNSLFLRFWGHYWLFIEGATTAFSYCDELCECIGFQAHWIDLPEGIVHYKDYLENPDLQPFTQTEFIAILSDINMTWGVDREKQKLPEWFHDEFYHLLFVEFNDLEKKIVKPMTLRLARSVQRSGQFIEVWKPTGRELHPRTRLIFR